MRKDCEGRNRSCETSRKTIPGAGVEMMSLELGYSCGQGCCALRSSRGHHSLVAAGGGETWIASRCITEVDQEVDHTGFDEGLNVRGKWPVLPSG